LQEQEFSLIFRIGVLFIYLLLKGAEGSRRL